MLFSHKKEGNPAICYNKMKLRGINGNGKNTAKKIFLKMKLEVIMLSRICQKNKYCMISLMCVCDFKKTYRNRYQIGGCQRQRVGDEGIK